MYNKLKNEFVKQTLEGLMFSGLPHVPSGPIIVKEHQKREILVIL